LAGFILWDAKVRYGRERAAASVLDVVEEDAEEGGVVAVGEVGTAAPPTAPVTLCEEPFLGS
jgi:predicted urease superfamily metal-dependent hydrolase